MLPPIGLTFVLKSGFQQHSRVCTSAVPYVTSILISQPKKGINKKIRMSIDEFLHRSGSLENPLSVESLFRSAQVTTYDFLDCSLVTECWPCV